MLLNFRIKATNLFFAFAATEFWRGSKCLVSNPIN